MIDLLIIGGGMHGTCLSHLLTRLTPLTRDDVRVLDPNDRPSLSLFRRHCQAVIEEQRLNEMRIKGMALSGSAKATWPPISRAMGRFSIPWSV